MGHPRGDRRKEHYYRAAKVQGYRSRSAFKLKQIIRQQRLLVGVKKVLELCCSPGGWTQVLREMSDSLEIIAVDLNPMRPIPGVIFIQGDITSPETIAEIQRVTNGTVDLVVSDCSPHVSGNWELDVARQIFLVETTIKIALQLIGSNGKILAKVFRGPGFEELNQSLRKEFTQVHLLKPDASRKTSAEIYILLYGPKCIDRTDRVC